MFFIGLHAIIMGLLWTRGQEPTDSASPFEGNNGRSWRLPAVLGFLSSAGLLLLVGLLCLGKHPSTFPAEAAVSGPGWDFDLPSHFAVPELPADNPLTAEKVALGRHLFYDTRLSVNGTTACSSCHIQALAFTDGKAHAVGATGQVHPRSAMGLTNIVYAARLAWANPLMDKLEHQALLPMFGEAPVEMGLAGKEDQILSMIEHDPTYQPLVSATWPDGQLSLERVVQAIASFERTLISSHSPYDRFLEGEEQALSPSARRGLDLFLSERLECFHCHGGFNFSDNLTHASLPTGVVTFHNTGLYNLDNKGAYPADNEGVFEITGDPTDMGRFKAPTLRNIAVTAPYMHDGSIATLEEVLDHYASGGRVIAKGPYAGDGSQNPLKSEFVAGFILSDTEKQDVVAFLKSLTDETFLTDPRFSNPWPSSQRSLPALVE